MRIRYPFAGKKPLNPRSPFYANEPVHSRRAIPVCPDSSNLSKLLTIYLSIGAFGFIILVSAYLGLSPHNDPESGDSNIPPSLKLNDKLLHLITFFLLSMTFYWILDTTRRRTLHITMVVCTLALGIGSEVLQALVPNGRSFDPFDVLANIVGSLGAVGMCTWYHKRMMERKRKSRFGAMLDGNRDDVELGVTNGNGNIGEQETGTTRVRTLEEEVDNWDENAVDTWEEGEEADGAAGDVGASVRKSSTANDRKEAEDGDKDKRAD